jgi:starch synthase
MAKIPSRKKSAKKISNPAPATPGKSAKPLPPQPIAKAPLSAKPASAPPNPAKDKIAPAKPLVATTLNVRTGNGASSVNTPAAKASFVPAPAPTARNPAPAAAKPSPAGSPAATGASKPGAGLAPVPPKPAPAATAPASVPPKPSSTVPPVAASNRTPVPVFNEARPPVTTPTAAKSGLPLPTAPAAGPTAKRRGRPPKIQLTSRASATATGTPRAQAPAVPEKLGRTNQPRRVAFVASECTPLAQSGGLGDVVAGLSKALVQRGHDVRIIMPLYAQIDRARYRISFMRSCCVHFGGGEEIWVGIFEGRLDDEVTVWFIDYDRFFGRPWLYDGSDEDGFRFGLLSKAAMQICKDTGFIPDVMHLHDWMSAPVAVFLKSWDRVLSPLSHTGSVLTLHNIGYQGKFHRSVLDFYGLGPEYMTPDKFEDFGAVNLLKAGIQYADMITTVSPTYAREIREPIGGMGLGLYLNDRGDRVRGILNGVDTELWNPQTDKFLPARYSVDNMAGKAACKKALQERLGLEVNPKIPIFGMVSRFAPQKGFDLIRGALPQAMRDMVIQVVALGSGDPVTENFFRWLHASFGGRAYGYIGFSPELAHLIEAGSDFFIMPSYYEPCGLNQMYSSLYGTLPIVRATGGLDDTVENYVEATGEGTGFKFWDPTDRALFYTLGWAVSTWFDRPQHYQAMQRRGMMRDFSWTSSAKQYEDVYEEAIAVRA